LGRGTLICEPVKIIGHNIAIAVIRPDDRREESAAWHGA